MEPGGLPDPAGPRPVAVRGGAEASLRSTAMREVIRRAGTGESGAVTTEFVILYGALLALVMSVIHFGLVFNASLAVTDAADSVLEAVQASGGTPAVAPDVARDVVGDERLVRDLSTDVDVSGGVVTVAVSARAPRIVPGLPTAVSHRVQGPVERFIPEGRR